MLRVLLVLALLGLPYPAAAEERARLLEYLGAGGQGRSTLTMIVTPTRLALNPGEDGALLADFEARTILVWDARGGRYMDLGMATRMAGSMGAMVGAGGIGDTSALEAAQAQVAGQIPGMLDGVPPDQRAAVQAAIEGAIGLGSGAPGTTLSGGEQQRVGLAQALLHDAELLVLDEPGAPFDGHPTVHARLRTADGTPLREYLLAPATALPGSEEVIEAIRRLVQLHIEITGQPIPPEAMMTDFSNLEPHGFPVVIDDFVEGDRWELNRWQAGLAEMAADGTFRWHPAQ